MAWRGEELPYSAKFFERLDEETLSSAEVIVPIVLELTHPTRIVDVGCGRGAWLSVFRKRGIRDVLGLDGPWVDRGQLLIPQEQFRAMDLTRAWSCPGHYDLALCLEVAEHLTARVAESLVERLTTLAPAVLFSAAVPGQGGVNHTNEQWPDYWKRFFESRRYVQLDPIRRLVWQDHRVVWYYQQNLYLYVSEGVLDQSTALRAEKELNDRCELTLIHSSILSRHVYFETAVRSLPQMLWAALKRRWLER